MDLKTKTLSAILAVNAIACISAGEYALENPELPSNSISEAMDQIPARASTFRLVQAIDKITGDNTAIKTMTTAAAYAGYAVTCFGESVGDIVGSSARDERLEENIHRSRSQFRRDMRITPKTPG